MKSLSDFLNKYGTIIILLLSLGCYINTCGLSGSIISATNKASRYQDSLLREEIKLEGLRTSKRMLMDCNEVILTKNRPDARIRDYDTKISATEKIENK